MENNDKILSNAQYKKSLSIAFFNATNAAIELISKKKVTQEKQQELIVLWRDWFLAEHKTYYATVIANIGKPYRAEESIAKLKATITLEELKAAWLALSEDERHDGEIKKVVNELKKQYQENEKPQS